MTMEIEVKNMQGETVKRIELPAAIFEAPINRDLMHQALVRQRANARLGTRDTKSRGEVAGGAKKPWKQKGTGRARQGSTRAPQWKGGGKVHTPTPRDYTQKMPRQMRRAALRSALSVKAADQQIVVVDELKLDAPKTAEMLKALAALVGADSALILLPARDEKVEKSIRNIEHAKYLRANYLNIRDLFGYDKVVMPLGALDVIQGYLG
ncbi:MAG TPA: 50S ribosomal protein L4 [Anaerolineales bacterium]|uniref:Large ribosomal subunit protein uL4 n=1 Tax=uncultured Chloroflexi bacterium Rifle_16ft_4_minimus_6153 TaxID=1665079 RepID=A0A0H4TCG3_9CHLR|nr:50S ribosomal protein L4, large subunit ribosomal protein L4 [uncultured Chloroflexi bacterium Rifle_16ft_4_minimus_6153]HLE30615.1 50S ribosomal protein L4 [Anaerolineales bacterium]